MKLEHLSSETLDPSNTSHITCSISQLNFDFRTGRDFAPQPLRFVDRQCGIFVRPRVFFELHIFLPLPSNNCVSDWSRFDERCDDWLLIWYDDWLLFIILIKINSFEYWEKMSWNPLFAKADTFDFVWLHVGSTLEDWALGITWHRNLIESSGVLWNAKYFITWNDLFSIIVDHTF